MQSGIVIINGNSVTISAQWLEFIRGLSGFLTMHGEIDRGHENEYKRRIVRSLRGMKVPRNFQFSRQPIDEAVLAKVEARLPKQPWPKGVHRQVRKDLQLSEKTYRRAVSELIRRGKFMRQIDGTLVPPHESTPN